MNHKWNELLEHISPHISLKNLHKVDGSAGGKMAEITWNELLLYSQKCLHKVEVGEIVAICQQG